MRLFLDHSLFASGRIVSLLLLSFTSNINRLYSNEISDIVCYG